MPTLQWIGKEKIINHHLDVPYRVLEHRYGFTENGKQEQPGGSGNMIINGDNLEALKSLLPEYEGKIKCIYIDPPYNTGNEGWVYNDNVNHPKIKKWLERTLSAREAGREAAIGTDDLTRHDKWLCMIYPRLQLLHRLLADDGAIFISIDDNEVASLKLLADEIFGSNNFIGYYNWFKSATPPNLSYKIKKNIEYILCYSRKSNSIRFSGTKKESKSDDPMTKPRNTVKELYFPPGSIHIGLSDRVIPKGIYGTGRFPNELLNDLVIEGNTNRNTAGFRNRFIWTQEKLLQEIAGNTRININAASLVLSYKKERYGNEAPPNLINADVGVDTTENAGRELMKIFGDKVFDYPKPDSLIRYLINFLCGKEDIILDSFAGSGTTAHAVLNLNKQDGGRRRFILIEMEEYAEAITAERVKRVISGYEGREGTGGGFDYYRLGPPLFDEEENLNSSVPEEQIRKYIWFTETRSTYTQHKGSFLGMYEGTAYYFIYEREALTVLDYKTLGKEVQVKAARYVIFADCCLLSEQFMENNRIEFKKIPRDITRF